MARWARIFVVVMALGSAAGACSLNPQPIPPGADDPGRAADAGSFSPTVPGAKSDGGLALSDASASENGDADTGGAFNDANTTPVDDASTDAPSDAATDAPADALTDAPND